MNLNLQMWEKSVWRFWHIRICHICLGQQTQYASLTWKEMIQRLTFPLLFRHRQTSNVVSIGRRSARLRNVVWKCMDYQPNGPGNVRAAKHTMKQDILFNKGILLFVEVQKIFSKVFTQYLINTYSYAISWWCEFQKSCMIYSHNGP